MREVFPAKGTFIWFLSCVCSLMSGEVHSLPEAFPTSQTFKEFLFSSVGSMVCKKGGTVTHGLPTLRKGVKSLFLMGSFMNNKV